MTEVFVEQPLVSPGSAKHQFGKAAYPLKECQYSECVLTWCATICASSNPSVEIIIQSVRTPKLTRIFGCTFGSVYRNPQLLRNLTQHPKHINETNCLL